MISSKEATTRLNVKSICGAHTLSRADGNKLHKLIVRHWGASKSIEIDFDNMTIASVSFLDESIGQLIMQFPMRGIITKLKLIRLPQFDRKLLNDIFAARIKQTRNAKRAENHS